MMVAAAQLRSGPDREDNLAQAVTALARAADQGAALVVLPEATSHWFGSNIRPAAEPLDGPFAQGVREAARQHGVTAVAGVFEPADHGRVHNTLLVTGPAGEVSYRKVHLFDALGSKESDVVSAGEEYVVTPIPDGDGGEVLLGLATCYDVRYAEQFTYLRSAGAQVVALCASWGAGPGKVDQWQVLTRARAMDAQAWLVAAGQAWQPPRGSAPLGVGHSAIVDPFGAVHGQLGADPGVLVSEIDVALAAQARTQIPLS